MDGELDRLLDLAATAAREAADLLVRRAATPIAGVGTKSSPTDMVSDVDREAERLLVGRLLAARPHDGVLGEEGGEHAGSSGVRWVVDPLDGTTNFLYGRADFAVSVAAERNGETVVGAVVDAVRGELFAAARGRGATRNGERISVSARTELARALVGTGFAYDATVRAEQAPVFAYVLPRVRDVRRAGSAALDLCAVACGRLDAYFERGLGPWDGAAGLLIAGEAGAVTRTGPGGYVQAAAPGVAAALDRLLDEAGQGAFVPWRP